MQATELAKELRRLADLIDPPQPKQIPATGFTCKHCGLPVFKRGEVWLHNTTPDYITCAFANGKGDDEAALQDTTSAEPEGVSRG